MAAFGEVSGLVVCVVLCAPLAVWAEDGGAGARAGDAVQRAVAQASQAAQQGGITKSGALPKEAIREVVQARRGEVRYCYESALLQEPSLEGVVKMRFVISATGAVESAEVSETTLGSAEVESCMLERLEAWAFPEPEAGVVVVNYPFVFSLPDASDRPAEKKMFEGGGVGVVGVSRPVRGLLNKDEIRGVVRRHRSAFRRCYEKQLRKDPKLRGEVKIKFTISAEGKVASARVTATTMWNVEVEDCVVDEVKTMVFPKPKGGGMVIVNYPFKFST